MKIKFDVTVILRRGAAYATAFAHTPRGLTFLEGQSSCELTMSTDVFLASVPPKLSVGLKSPRTKKFTQLPPRSLH